jgi:alkylation response protein AidB-like acyl-CoA dehydrogenase
VQKHKWLPPMARWEKIGCFEFTDPLVDSGTSVGLTTTTKREGDMWVLNGQKCWIGNATWCNVSISASGSGCISPPQASAARA